MTHLVWRTVWRAVISVKMHAVDSVKKKICYTSKPEADESVTVSGQEIFNLKFRMLYMYMSLTRNTSQGCELC